ncbi:MAG: SCP2 sterol-binding domain-containing protein [Lachnospiraceae bacterium]|jgi:multimeric flavodoxin WrbA|nr:SCP2 sterol-binding domain-containing protein [Lachnospiraceae bacterium]
MKINIYYGGRGVIDDPTLYVINKMQDILDELNVTVERFNLYELKNSITTLPQTLKTADGIILATTIEWYGIGGFMQQFLDACWLYGDKEKIAKIYMCPVVMSTTYGEAEGKLNLTVAWEILGGLPCSGFCGYITDAALLEDNSDYTHFIEKKTENLYRTIKQKLQSFPASNQAVKKMVSITKNIDLTPQESEQLSHYASDDVFIKRQKEDIIELTGLYRDMIYNDAKEEGEEFVIDFRNRFKPRAGFRAVYRVNIADRKKPLIIDVSGAALDIAYNDKSAERADVEMSVNRETLDEIVKGRMTFQRAFMTSKMNAKGDFMILRTLDSLFDFVAAE